MSKEYDAYLKKHVANVNKAYDWLTDNLPELIEDDPKFREQLKWHDVSKWGKDEYDAYDRYFYGSGEKNEDEFNKAWVHHIHNNPHHWQHWVLHEDEGKTLATEMPRNYILEMICDWFSFSLALGDIKELGRHYEKYKDKMILHENTRKTVEEIIKAIEEVA